MTDIALRWDEEQQAFDIALDAGDLLAEDGLETAVALSLFCHRRANPDDELPTDETDRRGWWGDALLADGDRIGSRRWLVWPGQKQMPSTAARVETYDAEALAWMRQDGIVGRITVGAEWIRLETLGETITATLGGAGERIAYRYAHLTGGVRVGNAL